MANNGKLLSAIDERTKYIQRDVSEIKKEISNLYEKANNNINHITEIQTNCKTRGIILRDIQKEHKNPFHNGVVLGLIKFLFGRS